MSHELSRFFVHRRFRGLSVMIVPSLSSPVLTLDFYRELSSALPQLGDFCFLLTHTCRAFGGGYTLEQICC